MNKKAKVGSSARQIMQKLYPPMGIRPETKAYVERCVKQGIRPMMISLAGY